MNLTNDIFTALCETEESAGIGCFISLLRSTPTLRHWLRLAVTKPRVFERFEALVEQKLIPPEHAQSGRRLLAWLTHAETLRGETAFLRTEAVNTPPTYGGLTSHQVVALIRIYQSGNMNTSAFLLAHAWRQKHRSTLVLLHASAPYLREALSNDRPQLLKELTRAAKFFHGRAPGTIKRTQFRYGDWWKLKVLSYMLQNPKPVYRTGEFHCALAASNLRVDPKDIRRFCAKHNIARDKRPGRPAKIP